MTLRDVMALAADRDLIARQYANGFQEVFHEVLPMIRAALRGGHPLETAIIAAFLGMLARHPDSLIVRKAGREVALSVTREGRRGPGRGLARHRRRPRAVAGIRRLAAARGETSSTPAPPPTWSRPPCSPPCGMAQFSCHVPRAPQAGRGLS